MKTNFLINYLFIILLVITLLLGFYGFYFEDSYKWYDAIYKTLQLFQLGAASPEQSVCINVARFLAPIVLIFGGMQLIMYVWQTGWKNLCIWSFTNHIVIIGYGNIVQKVIQKLKDDNRISGNERVIIVDPLLTEEKFSFRKILLKQEADKNLLKCRTKINKASKVIIATDNDYVNLKLREYIKDVAENIPIYIRIESLEDLKIADENTKIYKLDYPIKIDNIENHLIIVLGGGIIGKQIIRETHYKNKVFVVEQSANIINSLKDEWDDKKVCYNRADVKLSVAKDIDNILESYKEYKDIMIYICLGGDWLSFKTAYKWSKWLEKIEGKNIKICLFGNSIPPRLFDECNMSREIVKLKNINGEIIWV